MRRLEVEAKEPAGHRMAPAEPWPASPELVEEGLKMLAGLPPGSKIAVASDSDTDGLCAGALAMSALERVGHRPSWVVVRRGENSHDDALRSRIRATAPDALVVLDMGSRAGTIVPDLPTLVLDHHVPRGSPTGALLISAYGHSPVAPTSMLAYYFFGRVAPLPDLEWLSILGSYADQADPSLPDLADGLARHGKTAISQTSALLNAARRAPTPDPELAAQILRRARSASDISRGRIPEVQRLRELRAQVNSELARCGRSAPRFAGAIALIRIDSAAQIHPLLAQRWARRLPRYIALVANHGYLPGRVNFSMRTAQPVDMVALLRELNLDLGPEFGHGHPGATGGSVTPTDFDRLLERLGFPTQTGMNTASSREM